MVEESDVENMKKFKLIIEDQDVRVEWTELAHSM
jgi:hypothetical protein